MTGQDVETAEQKEPSYDIVLDSIKKLINIIRAVPEFQPKCTLKDAIKEIENSDRVENKMMKRQIYLYRILEQNGFVEMMRNKIKKSSTFVSPLQLIENDIHDHFQLELDRQTLLHHILLPLLSSLSHCYIEIDNQIHITEEAQQLQTGKKPPAPKGLLSLMDYTDIACLVEFTFCTGIVPHLEAHVLPSIQDRAKCLPKSFLGRLPRSSLGWGYEILQSFHKSDALYGVTLSKQQRLRAKIDFAIYEMEHVLLTIFQLLMLDRFRPILFPRHTTDLYGAIFQLERLRCLRNNLRRDDDTPSPSVRLKNICNMETTLGISTDIDANIHSSKIDVHSMAKAYQGILFSGLHAPQWLKMRVGNLLSSLAVSNSAGLIAIIDTFVVAVSGLSDGEMSSASARLGKALCTKSYEENKETYHSLLDHLLEILSFQDLVSETSSSSNNRFVACIYTSWSVLEHFPSSAKPYFYSKLVSGLFFVGSDSENSIKSIHSLLMFPPTTGKAITDFCRFLFSPIQTVLQGEAFEDSTAFGQMIRFACAEGTVICQTVTKASETLRMLIDIIASNKVELSASALPLKVLSVSLLQSLKPTFLDRSGYQFKRVLCSGVATVNFEKNHAPNDFLVPVESRISFVVNEIFCLHVAHGDGREAHLARISSYLFQLLLLIYFESSSMSERSMLPDSFRAQLDIYKLITMIMLPLLCEKCSPALLLMPENDPTGLLKTIILVLKAATDRIVIDDQNIKHELVSVEAFTGAISFVDHDLLHSSMSYVPNDMESSRNENLAIEIHSSITEIVISLLIAILELGSKERINEDEYILRCMLPYLKILATDQDSSFRPRCSDNFSAGMSLSVATAAIAEMSTYAISLICSRSVTEDSTIRTISCIEPSEDFIHKKISECELQLKSDQVPLRAKAVVELRKLVRGFISDISSERMSKLKKQIIIELNDEDSNIPNPHLFHINRILQLNVAALDDPESYVYLACLQTISAIGDIFPEHTISLLLNGITSGHITFSSSFEMTLSPTQKVKLIEAIVFIVRRRGVAVERYAAMILNKIIFGAVIASDHTTFIQDAEIHRLIQRETHMYYITNDDEYYDDSRITSERMIRLNTGGPVFDKEESDIIRSGFINLVSEILSASHPFQLAAYCPILVRLCIDALTLDHSRLVRRSIALLVRELYDCVFREAEDSEGTKFILSFLSSDEELLHRTCLRCIAASDLDINIGESKTKSVRDKVRLYDEAVISRCEEAMQIRHHLQDLISAAKVILESKKRLNDSDASRFLVKQFSI